MHQKKLWWIIGVKQVSWLFAACLWYWEVEQDRVRKYIEAKISTINRLHDNMQLKRKWLVQKKENILKLTKENPNQE